ncbi:ABC transporter permease [Mycolicibacterium baixiangningiae]|uniref:ABC transporter permease n=1 Tax=Mycolicibacterium baixiangningiae TaxID=2761578 RepID=UPI0018D1C866|nr:ABC transporter permease [Mycolicibacterium baixiangningiae]
MKFLTLYVAKRLLLAIPTILGLSALIFILLRLVPGDPAQVLAGDRADEEAIEALRESMGLNKPLVAQYFDTMGGILHGDFGTTLRGSGEVADHIRDNAVPTLTILFGGMALAIVVAPSLAIWAARRPDGPVDTAVRVFSTIGQALPPFWVGLMLLVVVAVPTAWFPVGGWDDASALDIVKSAALPAITLAISAAPMVMRGMRAELLDITSSDYIVAARAMGLSGSKLIHRYVLRNLFAAVVPLTAIVFVLMLAGVVVIESTFGIPGLGQSLTTGVRNRDFNLVQGVVLVIGVIVIAVYTLADVVVAVLDPRVRVS